VTRLGVRSFYAGVDSSDFSHADVERSRRYHGPLYVAFGVGLASSVAVYSLFAWSRIGDSAWGFVDGLGWAGGAAAFAALVVTAAELVRLPLAFWRGHVRERRFGFSTQTAAGWLRDRAKAFTLGLVLATGAWTAAVALGRALPTWWAAPAAAALALAVLVLSFLAPVVFEPLFNSFRPLADAGLAAELRSLAAGAGVPVRDVLVADASRRTTKVNAYVSGLGATRRVVLFDTLLAAAGERDVKLIVAHELGHRRDRHAAKATALAMLGAALAVLVLWAALGAPAPRDLPLALLVLAGLELGSMPVAAALSRRMERAADRCSLELTRDLEAFERAHVELARRNLSDLDPPRLAYLLMFTHPTPPERLALGRRWAAEGRAANS
jgi:Zn-dependent protease with chaperone function